MKPLEIFAITFTFVILLASVWWCITEQLTEM